MQEIEFQKLYVYYKFFLSLTELLTVLKKLAI